jgi:predicted HTH domain antitoxin
MEAALEPGDWRLRQLVKLEHAQPALVCQALDKLFAEDETLRWSLVVSAYIDAEISFARAAELLGMHPLDLRAQFIEKGVPLLLGPEDEADAQAEIDAMRSGRRSSQACPLFSTTYAQLACSTQTLQSDSSDTSPRRKTTQA